MVERGGRLVRIGYWKEPNHSDWPDPSRFIDPQWDPEERDDVACHLEGGMVVKSYMGPSRCRFCGTLNGNRELTDGVYVWPEGLSHYLREHQVRLPGVFADHVRRMIDVFDDVVIDDAWWRSRVSLE